METEIETERETEREREGRGTEGGREGPELKQDMQVLQVYTVIVRVIVESSHCLDVNNGDVCCVACYNRTNRTKQSLCRRGVVDGKKFAKKSN